MQAVSKNCSYYHCGRFRHYKLYITRSFGLMDTIPSLSRVFERSRNSNIEVEECLDFEGLPDDRRREQQSDAVYNYVLV